ncbi:zinc carboxypeptidase A 1-like [Drosophila sulfurigaster albostrigata]|uniref:zinc carboxypeptidase A 1-like n=1 Tax=Drosophila sulfurigaster albostrigata TaxID=89887 RepID=UPI002D21EB74|nr:zinc carboxypeptidase A 1-like [Drosophila sulfurigaster albostrigata]
MSLNKSLLFALFGLLATLAVGQAERVRYDNYRLYKANAANEAQLAVLKDLEGSSDSILFLDGVHIVGKDVQMVVAPHKVPDLLDLLGRAEIKYELQSKDFQKSMDEVDEKVAIKGRVGMTGRADDQYNWEQYYELEDTYTWMIQLASKYPHVVTLIEGGKSYQRRSILGVKISKSLSDKPGIFLEAGIHAREWISPAAATFIINQLLTSEVDSIKELADNYNWYVIPHANPDGYVYTHTTNRLWRKTRTPYGSCYGADPNRNWGFHWNEVGASDSPCSDTYAGPEAFSEIETYSLSQYIASIKDKIQLYISLHSYSQYLLYPYGHTNELPDNVKDFEQVFDAAIAAVSQRYSTKYTGGNIYDAIYPAAGASTDWAYGTQDVRMAFCYELRPSSNSILTGFRLPAEQIIPASEELLDSIVAMAAEVKALGYFDK